MRKAIYRGLAEAGGGGGGSKADPHTTLKFYFLICFALYFRFFSECHRFAFLGWLLSRAFRALPEAARAVKPANLALVLVGSDPGEKCRWCSVRKQRARLSASDPVRCCHRREGGVLFQTRVLFCCFCVFSIRDIRPRNTVFLCVWIRRVPASSVCSDTVFVVEGGGKGEWVLNTYQVHTR